LEPDKIAIQRAGNEPVVTAGGEYHWGKNFLRAEGLYTTRTLPPRDASAWFSTSPSLPQRDTRLAGGGVSFSAQHFGFAADLIRSETFAFGRDWYSSFALRLGNKPWRFLTAFDGAGSRYVDPNGAVPGVGSRSAFRLERSGKGASLFRVGTLFRGPGPGETAGLQDWGSAAFTKIDRHTLDAYYRFPAKKKQSGLRPLRFSLSWAEDRRDQSAVLDTYKASAAVGVWAVQAESEGYLSLTEEKRHGYRLSEGLAYSRGIFKAAAKVGYSSVLKKEEWVGAWNTSASTSLRWKGNRLTIKAATVDFPRNWSYTVSWTLQK
jgi:hypothetical protein